MNDEMLCGEAVRPNGGTAPARRGGPAAFPSSGHRYRWPCTQTGAEGAIGERYVSFPRKTDIRKTDGILGFSRDQHSSEDKPIINSSIPSKII